MGYTSFAGETKYYYVSSSAYTSGQARAELEWSESADRVSWDFYPQIAVGANTYWTRRLYGTYYITPPSGTATETSASATPTSGTTTNYSVGSAKSGYCLKGHSAYTATATVGWSINIETDPSEGEHFYVGYSSASASFTVPALASYTVSYDKNGGLSTPQSQTKWYNESLQLRDGISRTGYRFAGWNTNSSGTGTNYSALGTYTANAGVTLYAKWTANTYTVQYNSNPPSGTNQTATSSHTYNTPKTLTSIGTLGFTVTDYLFKGWATSSTGGVVYTDGQSVLNLTATQGATVNLYAVWEFQYTKPNIEDVTSYRVPDSFGTNANVDVLLTPAKKKLADGTSQFISTRVQVYYKLHTASSYTALANPPSVTTRQTVPQTITATLNTDYQYDVKVVAEGIDGGVVKVEQTMYDFITSAKFIMDFNGDYDSVGIFASAPDLTDVVKVEGDTHTNNLLIYVDTSSASGTDHDLYTALVSLGWWNDVNVNV